ncbi:MAG: ABC transporter ATP-binding protein [Actinomycetales bacterium]
MKNTWRLYRAVLEILPSRARRFLVGYATALAFLAVLDAAALGLLAIVLTPIITNAPLALPIIGSVPNESLIYVLGVVCLLIVAKSAMALTLNWRATRIFAGYELELGSRLFDSYLQSSWVDRLKRNSSDVVRLTDGSVSLTIASFILPATTLVGEVLSFSTIIVVLAVAQPFVAAITVVYLGLLGAALFFWVTKRARVAGQVSLRYSLRSSRLITEMVGALKEVTLRDKATVAASVVRENRVHTTRARSNAQFLAQVPRYVLEAGIIGGFALVGGVGYLIGGMETATTAVALFGLAGFRMAPSIVRFQSVTNQITVSTPHARRVVDEIERSELGTQHLATRPRRELPDEPQSLQLSNVTFRYEPTAADAVTNVSLIIPFGTTAAFVGASGAGKSTIIDLMLGLVEPVSGEIAVDGVPLEELTHAWRSRLGYVPQDVSLFDASVAQNVALTWTNDFDPERVKRALAQAQMLETIESRPGGINAMIGERGLALSGGQRQRLGIARALYAEPLVLVMDEATSALDSATEAAVTDAIRNLRGSMTIITVAHRLSTVKESDTIFYMENGDVSAHGTFDELVRNVPGFAVQARLAGLAEES